MKKFLTVFVSLMLVITASFMAVGCAQQAPNPADDQKPSYTVYMPDGAPALAMAKMMKDESGYEANVTYTVVDSTKIGGVISQNTADLALVPINAAAKLAGNGDKYKMVTVNTHGNLYIIGTGNAGNLSDLKGKKVGVVNLLNVPGLTFQSILQTAEIEFTLDAAAAGQNNVLLEDVSGTAVAGSFNGSGNSFEYIVTPEPAVSVVTSANTNVKIVLSLQTLWGGENGYPQAVLLVKNQIIENNKQFVKDFVQGMKDNVQWIKDNPADAVDAINSHLEEGYAGSLKAAKVTKDTVIRSAVSVQAAADAKEEVKAYLTKILQISSTSTAMPKDAFFADID